MMTETSEKGDTTGSLTSPIALGRTAEIYAWEDNQVLKLFYDWYGLDAIHYEARMSRAVHAAGLPVPAVGDLLQVNERNGLVYQRIDGVPMDDMLKRQPLKAGYYARRLADLHAQMHTNPIQVDIPSQRERLVYKINAAKALPERLRARALAALETMPVGKCLCHGDFHPHNVLITPQGEVVIDWVDASLGNPLADVARTVLLLSEVMSDSSPAPWAIKAFLRGWLKKYTRHYFKLQPGGEAEMQRWLPIVAAARISEGIPEIEAYILNFVEKNL